MASMSRRLREIATGVASCALLSAGPGCRRPTADISVEPEPTPADAEPDAPRKPEAECQRVVRDDFSPPQVIAARFVTATRVRLEFSESLGPVTSVNPRQFRLSWAYSAVSSDGYAEAYYYDLLGEDPSTPPMVVRGLETYEDAADRLGLVLSHPLPMTVCEEIAEMKADFESAKVEDEQGRAGLFLHYTSRGGDGVRDTAGNAMEDIGGEWALSYGARARALAGTEPVVAFDRLVELPCPLDGFSLPPGPS